jgi:hypothetical protein
MSDRRAARRHNRPRGWWLVILAGVVLGPTALAAPPRDLGQALEAARSTLTVDGRGLGGTGAAVLLPAIAAARYVFIGEDHVTREIPRFAAAVCDAMARQGGLAALAIEAGPEAARFVAGAVQHPDFTQRIAGQLQHYPDSIAFLNIRDEVDLVRHCAGAAGAEFSLWGLDQEFLGAAGWLLDGVSAEHPPAPAASLVAGLQAEAAADLRRATATGNPAQLYALAADRGALARAQMAVETSATPRARVLMASLAATTAIYEEDGAVSNRDRAVLLKRTLAADLQGLVPADGRVLLKFGDDHGYQGINPLGQRDLGNFVAELADGQNVGSLAIDVLGARGIHRRYAGYRRPTTLQPFTLVDDPDYRWLAPAIGRQAPGGWTLFDLRTLRHKSFSGIDPEMQREIYGYDLLLIVPVVTAADMIR